MDRRTLIRLGLATGASMFEPTMQANSARKRSSVACESQATASSANKLNKLRTPAT